MVNWKRTLRTPSSERFLGQRDGKDAIAVDLHYLTNHTVAGSVILLKDSGVTEAEVPELLAALDDEFLPDVDVNEGNLVFTVVIGEVLGTFEATDREVT